MVVEARKHVCAHNLHFLLIHVILGDYPLLTIIAIIQIMSLGFYLYRMRCPTCMHVNVLVHIYLGKCCDKLLKRKFSTVYIYNYLIVNSKWLWTTDYRLSG